MGRRVWLFLTAGGGREPRHARRNQAELAAAIEAVHVVISAMRFGPVSFNLAGTM